MSVSEEKVLAGNCFDKYRSTNPLHRRLVGEFIRSARALLAQADPKSVLEIGAGPGDLAA